MSDNYTQLYYHFVWATKDRVEFITEDLERILFLYIGTLCKSMGVRIFALNGMPDHIHIACSVPPTIAISDFMKNLKGKSAHYINRFDGSLYYIAWQPGYGALTFAKRNMNSVVTYINCQKERHASGRVLENMERCGVEYDPSSKCISELSETEDEQSGPMPE